MILEEANDLEVTKDLFRALSNQTCKILLLYSFSSPVSTLFRLESTALSFFLVALIEPPLDFDDTFGHPFDDRAAIAFSFFLREDPDELPGSLVESVIYGPFASLSIPSFAKTYRDPRQPFPRSLNESFYSHVNDDDQLALMSFGQCQFYYRIVKEYKECIVCTICKDTFTYSGFS